MLKPPSTVQLRVDGDTLVATGSASTEWVNETRRLVSFVPGITHYRDEDVTTVAIPELLNQVNRTVIHFGPGSILIEPSDRPALSALADALRSLEQAVAHSGERLRLAILGSADNIGPAALNLQLSKERAEAVLVALGGAHLGPSMVVRTGVRGPLETRRTSTDHATQRIVTFQASIEPLGHASEPSRP